MNGVASLVEKMNNELLPCKCSGKPVWIFGV